MYITLNDDKTITKVSVSGLEFSTDHGKTWQSFGYQLDDTVDSMRYIFKEDYLRGFKEENEIMQILTIYQERKEKELKKEYNEKKQAILDSDEYISRYNDLINTFNARLEELVNEEKAIQSEVFTMTPYNTTVKYEINETYELNLLHDLDEEMGEKSKALYNMLDEVKAMIAIVPSGENYDAKVVEILKNYDILDKKGKINA